MQLMLTGKNHFYQALTIKVKKPLDDCVKYVYNKLPSRVILSCIDEASDSQGGLWIRLHNS